MKLITADLHWTANPRDAYRHAFVKRLVSLAKQKQVEAIFILGDLTEAKDEHNATLTNQIVEHLKALASVAPVYIDRGNHDYHTDPYNSFFRFVRYIPLIRWIDQPTFLGDMNVTVLPHTNDYVRDWKGIHWSPLVFAHNTFTGANLGFGPPSQGIPTTAIPPGSKVVAGDIHIPQSFENVTYVGSPYLVDFGDDFQPRVLLIDGDNSMKSVPCPGPHKRLVEMSYNESELLYVTRVCGAVSKPNPGDILKVRVTLDAKRYAKWPEIKDRIYQEFRDCEVYSIIPDVEREEIAKRGIQSTKTNKTDKELLQQYGRARTVDQDTLKIGMEFL